MRKEETPEDSLVIQLHLRAQEFEKKGLEPSFAWDKAYLQHKVDHWPADWEQTLQVLIYGDFNPPASELNFSELDISISKDSQKDTPIEAARCVLKAKVKVHERSVSGLMDAINRINIFLGGLTLVSWGNGGCGWWCDLIHETIGSSQMRIENTFLSEVVKGTCNLPEPIRRKIEAALYWIREPNSMVLEWHRNDVLRTFSAYWNAFECLVDAINIKQPRYKCSKSEKQEKINQFVRENGGRLTPELIENCYRKYVNPGLVAKATHALEVCFKTEASLYTEQCFHLDTKVDRLYNVRNAINHGDIDAENPDELLRVNSRLGVLWFIIWRMFALFLRFPYPTDCSSLS